MKWAMPCVATSSASILAVSASSSRWPQRMAGPALGSWGLLVPFLSFVLGIITTGGCLVLQKHKALKRRDAAKGCRSMPDYDRMLWRNQTYDIIAGVLFIIGVFVGVLGLLCR